MVEFKKLPLAKLAMNTGQIEGLPANPRQWTQEELDKLAKSIEETPELLDARGAIVVPHKGKFVVLGGNMRVTAARKLDLKEMPCAVLPEDTAVKKLREIVVKDNGSFGAWDFDALANEWDDEPLTDWGVPAWHSAEVDEEYAAQQVEEDDFNEETDAVETRCKKGDIWQLGEHRLMCGDSTNTDDIAALMAGDKARMLFTSPPYSDMREYRGGKDLNVNSLAHFIERYRPYTDYQCVNLGIQRKDADILEYWNEYIKIARDCGYKMLAWNIWDKTQCGSIGNQSAFVPIRHEWIFVFGTEFYEINETWEKKKESIIEGRKMHGVRQPDGSMKYSTYGDRSKTYKQMESIVAIPAEQGQILKDHPAPFPVELPAEYIKAMSNKGDAIIEPFCGSGTTLIAAEQLGRKCYGMELDEHYCDVIIARWEKLTGQEAHKIN